MNRDEIKLRFPNASQSFIVQNSDDYDEGLRSMQSKPAKRLPLDFTQKREEARWHGPDGRFEIVFIVYAVRPCDWDGYDIKHLQDWLVSAGLLPGDGWKTLSGRVVSRKAATKDEEKTVIFITHQPCSP